MFGGAACLSTHWPGIFTIEGNPIPAAILQYLRTHVPHPGHHRIYFDHGTTTLDTLYESFQQQADSIMRSKDYSSTNWMSRKFVGADHSERAWGARLNIPFSFLLSRNSPPKE